MPLLLDLALKQQVGESEKNPLHTNMYVHHHNLFTYSKPKRIVTLTETQFI